MGLFDKIKDVIVDAAPVLVPMAINYFAPGMGSVASGALGAGVGSLIRGDDPEDALKAAALGGGIGALQAGFSGPKGSTFGENIRADLGKTGTFLGDPLSPANYRQSVGGTYGQSAPISADGRDYTNYGNYESASAPADGNLRVDMTGIGDGKNVQELATLEKPGYFFPETPTTTDITNSTQFAELTSGPNAMSADEAVAQLKKDFSPNFFQKAAVPLGGITAATMLLGEGEEDEEYDDYVSVYDPAIHKINVGTSPIPTRADVEVVYPYEEGGAVPPKYRGFSKLPEALQKKMDPELAKRFAAGGEVDYFPRRVGGIGPGIGSGTKDDVPAMLMDGEFVMTRNAVKAAGGGSMEKGIENMYGLMRNLEARA